MSDRDLTSAIAGTRPTPGYTGRCIFCGDPCYGRACPAHKDLLLAEQQLLRSHDPSPASTANGPGSSTKGV